jgi:hypothetical protein
VAFYHRWRRIWCAVAHASGDAAFSLPLRSSVDPSVVEPRPTPWPGPTSRRRPPALPEGPSESLNRNHEHLPSFAILSCPILSWVSPTAPERILRTRWRPFCPMRPQALAVGVTARRSLWAANAGLINRAHFHKHHALGPYNPRAHLPSRHPRCVIGSLSQGSCTALDLGLSYRIG